MDKTCKKSTSFISNNHSNSARSWYQTGPEEFNPKNKPCSKKSSFWFEREKYVQMKWSRCLPSFTAFFRSSCRRTSLLHVSRRLFATLATFFPGGAENNSFVFTCVNGSLGSHLKVNAQNGRTWSYLLQSFTSEQHARYQRQRAFCSYPGVHPWDSVEARAEVLRILLPCVILHQIWVVKSRKVEKRTSRGNCSHPEWTCVRSIIRM